ncbi:MAG: adenylosuccinate synthase [Phototrophicaceae bacterium]
MAVTILIGAQWGDEGKGRVADSLAAESDIVARYAGGDNAGHTLYVGNELFKLHLIPSGILHPNVVCLLGGGLVINPVNLLKEMDELAQRGIEITPERLVISSRAHLITPAHIALDTASERALGDQKIGTTLRGIGPAYMDKTGRQGIRAGEMLDTEAFGDQLKARMAATNDRLIMMGSLPLDADTVVMQYLEAAQRLIPYIQDTTAYLYRRLNEGARVLCEGAQGTLLDLDHGSYPFVTSSSPTAGGALTGLGFGPKHVERVLGVAKAFSTRVGSGPMPTELDGELAQRLRGTGENFWDEFGTTTGRPRRCGWLDVVMLRYSAQVNGFNDMFITKLDVLSGFDELKIAVAYQINGERYDFPPSTIAEMDQAIPIYEVLPGWSEDITGVRQWEDLPANARAYIQQIAELCGVPISSVSVGPEREQVIAL